MTTVEPIRDKANIKKVEKILAEKSCKRTHGLISCYRWFDYFRQLETGRFKNITSSGFLLLRVSIVGQV